MPLVELLMSALAVPIGKCLLKSYLGESAESIGGGILELAKQKLKDYSDQQEAKRKFERLGEQIVSRVVPLFERTEKSGEIVVEAVAREIARTLEGHISSEFLLKGNLDPAKLSSEFRSARPLPAGELSESETALYNRALDEIVRYLVGIAEELPAFHSAHAAQSLQLIDGLKDDLKRTLDHVQLIQRDLSTLALGADRVQVEAQTYEADYRQAVLSKLDYVELIGADIRPEAKRHSLSVAYVSLTMQTGLTGADTSAIQADALLDTLKPSSGRLLIRGEAGSGKSTLFRWIAIKAAGSRFSHASFIAYLRLETGKAWSGGLMPLRALERACRQWHGEFPEISTRFEKFMDLDATRWKSKAREYTTIGWRNHVPFFIRLRDCTTGLLPKPAEFPVYVAKQLGDPPTDWVKDILNTGRALLLIDGVDEIPKLNRNRLWEEMKALIDAYPRNYFILSTRPAAVPPEWLNSLGFREAVVSPMSEQDRKRFIENWHRAAARELERVGKPDPQLGEIAANLIEKLPNHPPVSRLAANPLLCAMICALHRERSQNLPETIRELCESICSMLLHRRERESDINLSEFPVCYRELEYEEKRSLVQAVAHYMVRNGESSIAKSQAKKMISEGLRRMPKRSPGDAHIILDNLIERSGILRETQPEWIDFIHNTIKEYLAGDRFANDNDAGLLAKHLNESDWKQVVLFAVGSRQRGFATDVIRRVLNDPARDAAGLRSRQILALQCRAVALDLDPQLKAQLQGLEANLFPPHTMGDAEALASAGDDAVAYLHYRKSRTARELAACVRSLRLIGSTAARKSLKAYLKDRRKAVVAELVEAVNPLEIEAVIETVCKGKALPHAISRRIVDLSPLVGCVDARYLNLSSSQVEDVSPLANLTKLRTLDMRHTRISTLEPLVKLAELEKIDVSFTAVSDIRLLAAFKNLSSLDVTATPVSDLKPLDASTELRILNISGTRVTDIEPLSGLEALVELNLAGTEVTDIRPLAELRALKVLSLSGSKVTEIQALARLEKLEKLDLAGTRVTNIQPLTELPSLRKLNISVTKVRNVSPLCRLSNLEVLILMGIPLPDVTGLDQLKCRIFAEQRGVLQTLGRGRI